MLSAGALSVKRENSLERDLERQANDAIREFERVLLSEIQRKNLPRGAFDALFNCKILALFDKKTLHIIYHKIESPVSEIHYVDKREHENLSLNEVANAAHHELGFNDRVSAIQIPMSIIGTNHISDAVKRLVKGTIEQFEEESKRINCPAGFESIQSLVDMFIGDHPQYEKNIFVAMRFKDGKQYKDIFETIQNASESLGFNAVRADQKSYPQDDDLWQNVCTYMIGCNYGICVFEQIDEREFNPNVPLEYGFMRALNKRVLLLKDSRMPNMPTDITGKIYRDFDSYNIYESIDAQVKEWLRHL